MPAADISPGAETPNDGGDGLQDYCEYNKMPPKKIVSRVISGDG